MGALDRFVKPIMVVNSDNQVLSRCNTIITPSVQFVAQSTFELGIGNWEEEERGRGGQGDKGTRRQGDRETRRLKSIIILYLLLATCYS